MPNPIEERKQSAQKIFVDKIIINDNDVIFNDDISEKLSDSKYNRQFKKLHLKYRKGINIVQFFSINFSYLKMEMLFSTKVINFK